jgi:hypothetical protein
MPEPTDILALFGRIDQIAGDHADDPRVEATIHRLLPGTAGYQQGWFAQVERFMRTVSGRESSPLPDYDDAVRSLGESRNPEDWAIPQQAKARYAATVLTELHYVVAGEQPSLTDDPELFNLAKVLEVGHQEDGAGPDFVDLIRRERPSHAGWRSFMSEAFDQGLVTEAEARLHPPARGKIRAFNEEFCTQLDTPYEDPDLDISAVAAVIDPRNWPGCCPYWKSVKVVMSPPNPAGWTRLCEVVQAKTADMDVTLRTPLIFRNDHVGDGVVVNYDLDPDLSGLSGADHDDFVYADSGYIWATPITKGQKPSGVRVKTRKVARIQGLGVAALAMYAYAMGWSTAGESLVLGCARKPPGKAVPFKATPPAKMVTPTPAPKAPPVPKLGAHERQEFVDKLVKATTQAIDDRSTKAADLVQRWLDGDLMPTEVTAAGSEAGMTLARTHAELHTAVTQAIPAPQGAPATQAQKNQKVLAKKAKKASGKKALLKEVPPKKAAPKKAIPKKGKHI